jgi:predicted phage terminase large subunit-like protein
MHIPDYGLTKYCPHQPNPKQQAFLWLTGREAFYGGAAGGGKSDALLMAALQFASIPDYRAVLIRRTFPQLSAPGGLMDRARRWLTPTDAKWAEQDKEWRFPSGAVLKFAFLDIEKDRDNFEGHEYQFVGFDELTQFREEDYEFVSFSRSRKPKEGPLANVPIRARSASNPGGRGHDWVKRRFIEEGRENGRIFIPAKVFDNDALDVEQYVDESLSHLSPLLRAQLLDGDWSVSLPGSLFRREWFDTASLPQKLRWVRFWDLAATEPSPDNKDPDYTVGLKMGFDPENGLWYVAHVARIRARPQGVEQLVKETADTDGRHVKVWIEQEPGSSGKNTIDHYSRRVLPEYEIRGLRSTGSKEERSGPVSSKAEQGLVKIVRASWNEAFLSEVAQFPSGSHDDQVDALSGAFTVLAQNRGPMSVGPDPFSVPQQPKRDRPIAQRIGERHGSLNHPRWAQRNFCPECAAENEED